jgi:hypothetical protein
MMSCDLTLKYRDKGNGTGLTDVWVFAPPHPPTLFPEIDFLAQTRAKEWSNGHWALAAIKHACDIPRRLSPPPFWAMNYPDLPA